MRTRHSQSEVEVRRAPRFTTSAFTLMEVILSLSLLALLSGMVFGIVRVSMTTAMETRQVQLENDELNRFISLCRHSFQSLPSTAILTLKITDTSQPIKQELTMSGAPDAFSFGLNPMSYNDTIIGTRPDYAATEAAESGQQLYYLALSRKDIIPKDPDTGDVVAQTSGEGVAAPDDLGRYWMPLMQNVSSLTWRFYKVDDDTWVEEWDSTNLPQLVEMNLLLAERTLPIRVVFALPTVKLAGANPALRPQTTTSSTSDQAAAAVVETMEAAAATIRTVDGAAVMAAIVAVVVTAAVAVEMGVDVEVRVALVDPMVAVAAQVVVAPAAAKVKVRARGILAAARNLVAVAVVLQVRHRAAEAAVVAAAGRHSFRWVCG